MSLLNRGVMLPWQLLKFCLFSRGINESTVEKNGLSTYTTLHLYLSCGINITIEGRPLLGAPIGTQSFASDFIQEQIGEWVAEVKALYSAAKTQPQTAIYGLCCPILRAWRESGLTSRGRVKSPVNSSLLWRRWSCSILFLQYGTCSQR